jgi:hypothetical protein
MKSKNLSDVSKLLKVCGETARRVMEKVDHDKHGRMYFTMASDADLKEALKLVRADRREFFANKRDSEKLCQNDPSNDAPESRCDSSVASDNAIDSLVQELKGCPARETWSLLFEKRFGERDTVEFSGEHRWRVVGIDISCVYPGSVMLRVQNRVGELRVVSIAEWEDACKA